MLNKNAAQSLVFSTNWNSLIDASNRQTNKVVAKLVGNRNELLESPHFTYILDRRMAQRNAE